MNNPLTDAINAERASRAGSITEAPARNTAAAANEIDPARIASLASALTGATKSQDKSTSYSMPCMQCGCVNTFTDDDLDGWKTDSETSETDGDDDEQDGGTDSDREEDPDDGDDDGSNYDDKLEAAVKKAVLAERANHTRSINQVKTLIEAMTNLRRSR